MSAPERHPATASWVFPPADRAPPPAPIERVNLRELAARPARFEHHLMVVASVGGLQLELPTASEPLYFAHVNVSDEYVLGLPSGDPLMDAFPMRVFLGDAASGADVARIRHVAGDLVLHPHGYLHWTGRLRPPYEPPPFPPGMRRSGLSLVMCAARPTPPSPRRPLFVSDGLADEVKLYSDEPVPALLARLGDEAPRELAVVGDTRIELLVRPTSVVPPLGGWVVVLEADEAGPHHATDLLRVPAGETLDATGIARALLVSSPSAEPDPPPPSWSAVPEPPFAPYEDAEPGELPWSAAGLVVEAVDEATARVRVEGGAASAEVPRYWMARMLFRLAVHGFRLGRLETYGGFRYDDRPGVAPDGHVLLGPGEAMVSVPAAEAGALVESLYRAVAPPGYTERLD